MRYFLAVLLIFFVPFAFVSGKVPEKTTPVIFPDLQKFSIQLSCALPDKISLAKEVYYLNEPKPEKLHAENQWWGVTTDLRTGKKFAQWIIKSNGVWISSKYNWGLFFIYIPKNGWKEVSHDEFAKEIKNTLSVKKRVALQQTKCTRSP